MRRAAALAALLCAAVVLTGPAVPARALVCNTGAANCNNTYVNLPLDALMSGSLAPNAATCFTVSPGVGKGLLLWSSGMNVRVKTVKGTTSDPLVAGQCSWNALSCDTSIGTLRIGLFCNGGAPCNYQLSALTRRVGRPSALLSQSEAVPYASSNLRVHYLHKATVVNATRYPHDSVRYYPPGMSPPDVYVGSTVALANNSIAIGTPYGLGNIPVTWQFQLVSRRTPMLNALPESIYFCTACCTFVECDGIGQEGRYTSIRVQPYSGGNTYTNYYSCSAFAGNAMAMTEDATFVLTPLTYRTLGILRFETRQSTTDQNDGSISANEQAYVVEDTLLNFSADIQGVLIKGNTTALVTSCSQQRVSAVYVHETLRSGNSWSSASLVFENTYSTSLLGVSCNYEHPLEASRNSSLLIMGFPELGLVAVHDRLTNRTGLVNSTTVTGTTTTSTSFGRALAYDEARQLILIGDKREFYSVSIDTLYNISQPLTFSTRGVSLSNLQLGLRNSFDSYIAGLAGAMDINENFHVFYDYNGNMGQETASLASTPPGTMARIGAVGQCPPGTFKPNHGVNSCEFCVQNQYSPSFGASACQVCVNTSDVCPAAGSTPLRYSVYSSRHLFPFGASSSSNDPGDVVVSDLFIYLTQPYLPAVLALTALLFFFCLVAICSMRIRNCLRAADKNKELMFVAETMRLHEHGTVIGGALTLWLGGVLTIGFAFLIVYATSYSSCALPVHPTYANAFGDPYTNGSDYSQDLTICPESDLTTNNIQRVEAINSFANQDTDTEALLEALELSSPITLGIDLMGFVTPNIPCTSLCASTVLASEGCYVSSIDTPCSLSAQTSLRCESTHNDRTCRLLADLPSQHSLGSVASLTFAMPINVYAQAVSGVAFVNSSTVATSSSSQSTLDVLPSFGRVTRTASTGSVLKGSVPLKMSYQLGTRTTQLSYTDSSTTVTRGFIIFLPEKFSAVSEQPVRTSISSSDRLNVTVQLTPESFWMSQTESESVSSVSLVFTLLLAFIGLYDLIDIVIGILKAVTKAIVNMRNKLHHLDQERRRRRRQMKISSTAALAALRMSAHGTPRNPPPDDGSGSMRSASESDRRNTPRRLEPIGAASLARWGTAQPQTPGDVAFHMGPDSMINVPAETINASPRRGSNGSSDSREPLTPPAAGSTHWP